MSARNKAKPKLTLKKEVIEVSAEDHAKLKKVLDNPPEPNEALKSLGRKKPGSDPTPCRPRKKKKTCPEPKVLTPNEKEVAEKFLESMPIQAIPMPPRFGMVIERHFGGIPLIPHCYQGVLNACRYNTETGEIQLVLIKGATEEDFIHEYAHYMAFTYAPDLVCAASETLNETFANLMVSKVYGQKFLPNPGKFVRDFYKRVLDDE